MNISRNLARGLSAAAVLGGLAVAFTTAQARPGAGRHSMGEGPDGGPGGHPGRIFGHGHGGGPLSRFRDVPTTAIVTRMAKRLELTDDQQTKIAAILDGTRETLRANADDARETLKATREGIEEILNPEQKEKARKNIHAPMGAIGGFVRQHGPEMREKFGEAREGLKMHGALRGLDLTADQKVALKELHTSASAERKAIMAETKPRLDAIRDKAMAAVDAILTEAQREELKERMDTMPDGPPPPPPHGRRGATMDRRGLDDRGPQGGFGPRDRTGAGGPPPLHDDYAMERGAGPDDRDDRMASADRPMGPPPSFREEGPDRRGPDGSHGHGGPGGPGHPDPEDDLLTDLFR